jgi:Flp pilus assembly protein TadG
MARRMQRWNRDQRGALSFEAVLIFPILVWLFVATFVFFDLFRTANTNAKAAYAIADLLSRQNMPVTQDYLEGLAEVYAVLAQSRQPSSLRVSSIDWDTVNETYRIRWSRGTQGGQALGADQLQDLVEAGRLPELAIGETIILVETSMTYTPAVNIGIPAQRFGHVIPTRPRFVPRLVLDEAMS